MACKFGNVDLGHVRSVVPQTTKLYTGKYVSGELQSFAQSCVVANSRWRVEGAYKQASQATLESLRSLQNDEVALLEIPVFDLYVWGKLEDLQFSVDDDYADQLNYSFTLVGCSCIGYTYVDTDEVYLHDLSYRTRLLRLDPHVHKCNGSYSSDRLSLGYDFYVCNRGTQTLTGTLEFCVGDDLASFKLERYDGTVFAAVGTWGAGLTAWGSSLALNDGVAVHTLVAAFGTRGAGLANGTVSYRLGPEYRVLLTCSSMLAGGDGSTDYAGGQLLLRTTLTHTVAESGVRDYVKVTYEDGSLAQAVS